MRVFVFATFCWACGGAAVPAPAPAPPVPALDWWEGDWTLDTERLRFDDGLLTLPTDARRVAEDLVAGLNGDFAIHLAGGRLRSMAGDAYTDVGYIVVRADAARVLLRTDEGAEVELEWTAPDRLRLLGAVATPLRRVLRVESGS